MEHHRGLEERVLNHDKQLVKVETILERVADNQDKMTDSLSDIASTLSKMNTLEESTKGSFVRLHDRVDGYHNELEVLKDDIKSKMLLLNPIFTILKYPRATLLAVIGLYFMAISDFRDIILSSIKLFG